MGTERADYGFDAPPILGGLVVAAVISTVLGASIARLVLIPAVFFWLAASAMAWGSRVGKRRWARALVDGVGWRGDERVLDVGCGRGLVLIEAAKRLEGGRAFGADIWSTTDQSGNAPSRTWRNAAAEGVADRVEIVTATGSRLPFPDRSFDVVFSALALHNIRSEELRRQAMRELGRVLKPTGRVAVFDIAKTREYVQELAAAGLVEVRRSGKGALFLMPVHAVTARGPAASQS